MKISISKKTILYEITVLAAVFNDVFRIGPITLYRALLLFALLKCYIDDKGSFKFFLKISIGTFAINLIQAFVFSKVNGLGLGFNVSRFLKYQLFYISIFSLFLICRNLYYMYKPYSDQKMIKYITFVSWLVLFAMIIITVLGNYNAITKYGFSNVNNYAAYIVAVMPFYLLNRNKKIFSLIYFAISIVTIVINDCTIALFGIILEIIVIFIIKRNRSLIYWISAFLVLSIGTQIFIYTIVNDIPFLSQNLGVFFKNFFGNLIRDEMFGSSNTTVSFRSNIFVMGIRWIKKSFLLGVGAGNASRIMTKELMQYNLYSKFVDGGNFVALHNGLLEFLLEFGFLALYLFYRYFVFVFRTIKQKHKNYVTDICVVFFVTFPIWILGPSGITSTYFIYLIMAFLIYSESNKSNFGLL